MRDFEVIFTDWIIDRTVRSKVYAVNDRCFLIADSEKFMWVPIESCELPIDRADVYSTYDDDDDTTESGSHWDSYDRWVEESQKDY